jgi:hypothetical protein
MRMQQTKIEVPYAFRDVTLSESRCRCGSCETIHIEITEDDQDPAPPIRYNVGKEGEWDGIGEGDYEQMRVLANVIWGMGKRILQLEAQAKP